jgi:hypothetical protein
MGHFEREIKSSVFVFMAFGVEQRYCIDMRFFMEEVKIALYAQLSKTSAFPPLIAETAVISYQQHQKMQ